MRDCKLAFGSLHDVSKTLIVVNVARQNQIGISSRGFEAAGKNLIGNAAARMLGIARKWRVMNGHDQCKVGVGSLQFALKPIDLILMNLRLGLADVRKYADDRGERRGECPINVRQIHLRAVSAGFERTWLGWILRHEILHPTVERDFGWINRAVLRIVGLAIVVARNGNDKGGIVFVGFGEVGAELIDIAGKINQAAGGVEKRRLLGV